MSEYNYRAWQWDVFGDGEIVIIKHKKPNLLRMVITVLFLGSTWTEKETDRFGQIVELNDE